MTDDNISREDESLDNESDKKQHSQNESEDNLKECLQNLFSGPSQSLESAFGILLKMIQEQSAEHKKLKNAQEELKSKCNQKIRQIEDLHRSAIDNHEEQQKRYQGTISSLRDGHEQLENSHKKLSNELSEMKQEIKVMAYNFHGFEELMESSTPPKEPQAVPIPDINVQDDLSIEDTHEDNQDEKCEENNKENNKENNEEKCEENSEENIEGETGEKVTLSSEEDEEKSQVQKEVEEEEHEESSESEDESVHDEPSDKTTYVEIVNNYDQEAPTTPIRHLTSHLSRRASINVAKHKLNANMTLAVRMERLENARVEMERGLKELKDLHIQNSSEFSGDREKDLPTRGDLLDVSTRVSAVEKFLDGFDDSFGGASEQHADNVEDSFSFTETANSGPESTTNVALEVSNNELHDKTPDEATSEEQNQSDRNNENAKVDASKHQTSDSQISSTVSAIKSDSEHSTDIQNVEGKARNQPGGLMLYLKDQENRTKNDLNDLSQQLSILSDKLSQRISRKSMQVHLANLQLGKESPSTGVDSDNTLSVFAEDMEGLRNMITQLENALHEKVSTSMLDLEFKTLVETDTGKIVESTESKPLKQFKTKLDEELEHLRQSKVDKSDLSNEIKESETRLSNDVDDKFSTHQAYITDTLSTIQEDMNACREYINLLEAKLLDNHLDSQEEGSPRDFADKDYLDSMVKQATDAVQVSLEESLESRLEELKTMEDDIEHLASKLSEKPDQEQINRMLAELEETLSQRSGHDHTIQMILDNIKIELRQRMTRAEVLSLVKHLLDEAKQSLKNTKESLMVGRVPYRCLGCNQAFPNGVNGRTAQKVNHRALPSSSGLVSGVYTQKRQGRVRGRPGALRPLQLSHTPGRPRTTGTMRFPVRPSSIDNARSMHNRSR